MSIWTILFGGDQTTEPTEFENRMAPPAGDTEVPYGIASKPMPDGEDVETLLPSQVGSYLREPIRSSSNRGPIYANYRSGLSTVFVELGICGNSGSAKMGLSTAKAETDAEFPGVKHLFVTKGDPAFFRVTTKLGALMAWTRGGYYFSAHAQGGDADLDAFLSEFPY